jgi:hypothetical protein
MSDDRTIEEMAKDSVARFLAEHEAERNKNAPPPPTTEQQIEARLAQTRFRELVTNEALLHGVRPHATRHVLRDAEAVFTLKDGTLVPRHGQTDPSDPLSPLTPARWFQDLAKTDDYLFAEPGRAH